MRKQGVSTLAGVCACVLAAMSCAAVGTDDFEGLDSPLPAQAQAAREATLQPPRPPAYSHSAGFKWQMPSLEEHLLEIAGVIFLAAFAINYLRGRRVNEALALHWASTFCMDGGVIDQNFALVGPGHGEQGEKMLMKQSQDQFELWASGRRCVRA